MDVGLDLETITAIVEAARGVIMTSPEGLREALAAGQRTGDVIFTGTPAGVGPVTAGQRVEVSIQGIGRLSNPFVSAEE